MCGFYKMANRYVKNKTTIVRDDEDSSSPKLIFGDYVKTLNKKNGKYVKVKYGVTTDHTGWIKEDHLTPKATLEFYFIDVGQGDSTFIVTPKRKKILIDGGVNYDALKFLSWKYKLEQVSKTKPLVIDLLVLTHADEDHLNGLIHIISSEKIKVKQIIHSGLAIYKKTGDKLGNSVKIRKRKYITTMHSGLDELDSFPLKPQFAKWKKAIENDNPNVVYHSVNNDSDPIDIGDSSITIDVLGPKLEYDDNDNPLYRWHGSHSHTINGHSVVLAIQYKNVRCLLSGDLEDKSEKFLVEDNNLKQKMDAHILKAPHHGSHHFYQEWLDAVNPQLTVISSGETPDHGHPRAIFLGAVGNASRTNSLMFSTELAATFSKFNKDDEKFLNQEKRLSSEQLSLL